MRYVVTAILLLAPLGSALAGSLPFTRSGVIDTPDAYVLQHTEIELELGASAYTVEDSTGTANSEFMVTGHLDVGLYRYGQIGVAFLGDGGIVGNAKVAILHEGITVPAFAIGVENITGEEYVDCFKVQDSTGTEIFYPYDHAQNWSAYAVLSKDLSYLMGIPATVNLGIGIGRFVGIVDSGALGIGSSVANGIFGSVVYHPSELITVAMEQDGRDLNIGATYEINDYITLQMAWAEIEQTIFPAEGQNKMDIQQNSKVAIGIQSTIGPIFGARQMELEREQQRIERARGRLEELEARRRAAEAELQRLRDLLENR